MAQFARGVEELGRRGRAGTWAEASSELVRRLARRDGLAAALLIVLTLVLYMPGIAALPVTDRDEGRFVQATRQMHETGDFLDIRFQEETRYKKPVGIYWLQALATSPFGGADAPIWAFRIPSVLGAIVAVLGTWAAGRILFGREAGLLAGLIFAPTLVLAVEAHLAKTDAALLASIVAAQAVLARAWLASRVGPGQGTAPALSIPAALLFWAACGIGVLIKGPILPLVCGATALGLSVAARSPAWLRALRPAVGIPVFLLIVLPWVAAIAIVSEGAFFREAIGGDFLAKLGEGQESHGAPPGAHLLAFPVVAWPMSALALLAVPFAFRHRRDPAVLFCLMWLIPAWLVFEAAATKLLHYTLPLYPAAALIAGAALARGELSLQGWWRKAAALLLPAVPLLVLAALLALAWILGDPLPVLGYALAACSALAAILAWKALAERDAAPALGGAALSATLLYAGVFGFAAPGLKSLWLSREIVAAAADRAGCENPALAAAGYSEPSLVVAAGTTTLLSGARDAAEWLAAGGCRVAAVEEERRARFLSHAAEIGLEPDQVAVIRGFNYSHGEPAAIHLYRAGLEGAP